MPIIWDGAGGIFTKLGKLVKAINVVDGQEGPGSSSFYAVFDEFLDTLTDSDRDYLNAALTSYSQGLGSYASIKSDIIRFTTNILNVGIVDGEGLGQYITDVNELIALLRFYMGRDSKVLNVVNSISVPEFATAVSGNVGNTVIAATGNGVLRNGSTSSSEKTLEYARHGIAQNEEQIVPQNYTVKCASSSVSGNEVLIVEGARPTRGVYSFDWKKVGVIGNLRVSSSTGNTITTNGGFESVSGSGGSTSFSGWTIKIGTPGTHFISETSVIFRGSRSLLVSATTTVLSEMVQPIIGLSGLRKYLLALRYRRNGSGGNSGTFKAFVRGTGFSVDSTEEISITVNAADSQWTMAYKWFNLPRELPTDMEVVLKFSAVSSGTPQIYIDEVVLVAPLESSDGLRLAAIVGSIDPDVNDTWTLAVSNNLAGKFQTFFGRFFSYKLPSGTVGNIPDALAT